MLFGTNIHVVLGATIAATIVDLIFALFFGIPCHYLLFYGIHRENKRYLTPFLIFYCTNFILNVIFSSITVIATIVDVRRLLRGQVFYDFGWIAFQVSYRRMLITHKIIQNFSN
ncbi:hypothetical protein X798_07523 [Onchocerca flexuosa]|uniref:Uncharacterized protein n=1 Tax=Onchocerca flexuosa TaxID=387005 RepID=A0A238BJY0_9BILA|nr:hypothetical protein X798_07523 [Onchocerca flexuosa]